MRQRLLGSALALSALIALPLFAQSQPPAPAAAPAEVTATSPAAPAAAAVVAAPPAPAHRDTVFLKDGSQLVGEVLQVARGELILRTAFAGDLRIKSDALAGISADRKLMLALPSGDRVAGVPKYDPATGQSLTGTAFGDVKLANGVDSAWPVGQPEPQTVVQQQEVAAMQKAHEEQIAAVKAEQAKAIEAAKAEVAKAAAKWTARLELGLNGSTGNTERTNLIGKAEVNRVTANDRFLAFIQGTYSSDNGVRSKNEILGGIREEVDISDRWFVFGKAELEFDEFENLDLRATATAGVGYFFIKEKDHELKGRAGVGYQHESFDDGTTNNSAIVEAGYDYRVDLWEWLRFTHSLTYYPELDDPIKDYRLRIETAGEVPLAVKADGWKIRAGMRNDYDATPRPGVERLDTQYFLNLVYELK